METAVHTSRLRVGRLRAEYLVSTAHPNPLRVRQRMDEAAAQWLPEEMRGVLGSQFGRHDEGVWVIRRLDLHLVADAAWSPEQVARRWTHALGRTLAQAVQKESDEVVRFPNRATYLACFLADLATGQAWSLWYYEPFQGLRSLPVSAALRTALCEDPGTGLAALHHLARSPRAQIISALTASDARRVLEHLSAGITRGEPDACFGALQGAWHEEAGFAMQAGREAQEALRLYVEACRHQPEPEGMLLRTLAQAFVRLARRLDERSAAQGEALIAALTAADPSVLYREVGAASAEVLGALRRVSPALVREAGRGLLAQTVRPEPAAEGGRRSTPFGGMFLLLPLLDALPLEAATREWPAVGGTPAANLLRGLLLAKCLGGRRARRLFFDPLVRDLVKIDPTLTLANVARWQARLVSEGRLEGLMAQVATWQRTSGAARGEAVALASIALPGAPAGVVVDLHRGVWLYARGYAVRQPHRFVQCLQAWLDRAGWAPRSLYGGPVFAEAWRATPTDIALHSLEETVSGAAGQDTAPGLIPARLSDDLDYLLWPASFPFVRSADLALSVVAQGVLRAFAWRLPGFAASSLPYLFANVLDVPGSLEDEATRRVVRLGRPPLQPVLSMSGMARRSYRLGWTDERPFELFQE